MGAQGRGIAWWIRFAGECVFLGGWLMGAEAMELRIGVQVAGVLLALAIWHWLFEGARDVIATRRKRESL